MSKSKRNYREPNEIFDRYGADALRWYFFANQPPWTSIRYSEQAIKDCIPEFLLRLWNVYSFFVIYANIDGFDPAAEIAGAGRPVERADVCRKAKTYRPGFDAAASGPLDPQRTEPHGGGGRRADGRLRQFRRLPAADRVRRRPEQLVRPPQPRPFLEQRADSPDKTDAYWTLYECLLTTCKLIAPFVPFLAEAMWQNLAVAAFAGRPASRAAVRKRPSVRLSAAGDRGRDRPAAFRADGAGARDRLAGPQRPDGREAQGAPAAEPASRSFWPTPRIRRGSKSTPR